MIIKQDDCMACLMCSEYCPVGAIEVNGSAAGYGGAIINQDKCLNCGACLECDCPGDAISQDLPGGTVSVH